MNTIYWLWLFLKRKITPAKALKLISHFHTAKSVYSAAEKDYKKCGFLTKADVEALCDKDLEDAGEEMRIACEMGVSFITYNSSFYPPLLRFIDNPPVLLYAMGDISVIKSDAMFCIVGTRNATAYGMSAALAVSRQLAEFGMVIVSGLAVGIDSAAHKGTIAAGGKTIGVAGCGLDVDYPSGSGDMKKSICKNGAIISEFRFKTPPYGKNFPIRNRVLSGMCSGVAVIEAGAKSGSLITATYAAEQGRDVYALPGNISNPKSGGTNALIQDGARMILSAEELIYDFVLKYSNVIKPRTDNESPPTAVAYNNIYNSVDKVAEPQREYETKQPKQDLTDEEKTLLKLLKKTPVHIDEICQNCGIDIAKINSVLVKLQIKNMISEHPGRYYSLPD